MKESEKVELFMKAVYTLKCKVVPNASIPKGVVELRVHSEDEEALKKMDDITDPVAARAGFDMVSEIHTRLYGKDHTDLLIKSMMIETQHLLTQNVYKEITGKQFRNRSIASRIRRFFS